MVAALLQGHDQDILDMHNTKSGRVFILGNGPSLLDQDLTKLRDEATFCCNGFPTWKDRPFDPTYFGVTDIYAQHYLDDRVFPEVDMMRFHISWPGDHYPTNDAFIWVEKAAESVHMDVEGFAGCGSGLPPIPTGRTSPLTNAQLAAWMGYREFYFLGIEQTRGYAYDINAVTGHRGRLFPIDSNPSYRLAIKRCGRRMREDIEAAGGKVYDCSLGGILNITGMEIHGAAGIPAEDILPYVDLREVLG